MQKFTWLPLCATYFLVVGSLGTAWAGPRPILGPMHQSTLCAAFAEYEGVQSGRDLVLDGTGVLETLTGVAKNSPVGSNASKAAEAILENFGSYSYLETKSLDKVALAFSTAAGIAESNLQFPPDPTYSAEEALSAQILQGKRDFRKNKNFRIWSGLRNLLIGTVTVALVPDSLINLGTGGVFGLVAIQRFYTAYKLKFITHELPKLPPQGPINWSGPLTQEDWLAELQASASYQYVHGLHVFRVKGEDEAERFILAIPTSL
jgi:hypothetical protein